MSIRDAAPLPVVDRRATWRAKPVYTAAASVVAGICWFSSIALVGRRPYQARELADRLDDIEHMKIIDPWIASLLQVVPYMAAAVALLVVLVPYRWRWVTLAPMLTVIAALWTVRSALSTSTWTAPTSTLTIALVGECTAVIAAAMPIRLVGRSTNALVASNTRGQATHRARPSPSRRSALPEEALRGQCRSAPLFGGDDLDPSPARVKTGAVGDQSEPGRQVEVS